MPVLERARNVVVNVNGDPVDNSQKTGNSGLKDLLDASYPEAAHDSSSHPTSTFPGTRVQYIQDITGWALALATERHFWMMWMEGPAGVGKSAVAQSCAERADEKLAAAFFFSRPNNRDDPKRLFPSIAYQLTTRCPAYRNKLNKKISDDPSLVNKSIDVQFQKLIVLPLQELEKEGRGVEERVVFIDGLDECAGEDAQCTIIDIISASVHDRTTPLIWAFFSRPEPRIVAQFAAPHVHDLCWRLILPVSRDADKDVRLYLEDGFKKIRARYSIPSAMVWPSEDDVQTLVERSEGLFIYPTSVIRFVGEGGPLGPEEQFRLVLRLPSKLSSNPWSHLDTFYTLIMEQIPNDMLIIVLKLLLLTRLQRVGGSSSGVATRVLGLSLHTYCAALSKLHSVVKFKHTSTGQPEYLSFYHASFMEFSVDPKRSGRFCVEAPETRAKLFVDVIRRINNLGINSTCLLL